MAFAPGDLLLELGAGTGEVGAEICGRLPAGSIHLALDLSLAMLVQLGKKAPARLARALADGSRRWPVENGRAAAIFCSRAAHRLDGAAFVAETRRVLRPGGIVVFGALERSADSVRAALQHKMRRILAEALGEAGQTAGRPAERDSRREHRQLAAALGGQLEVVAASSFEVFERPADSLAGWRSKRGLAGIEVPPEKQDEVLDRLQEWAREQYGDLNTPRPAIEHYQLTIVRPGQAEEKT